MSKEQTLQTALKERNAAFHRFLTATTVAELNEARQSLLLWGRIVEITRISPNVEASK